MRATHGEALGYEISFGDGFVDRNSNIWEGLPKGIDQVPQGVNTSVFRKLRIVEQVVFREKLGELVKITFVPDLLSPTFHKNLLGLRLD